MSVDISGIGEYNRSPTIPGIFTTTEMQSTAGRYRYAEQVSTRYFQW